MDTHEGWNKGNPDGLDHGIYAVGITFIAALFNVFVIAALLLNIYIILEERRQEKNMNTGLENKPWLWSQNRLQDIIFPLIGSVIGGLIGVSIKGLFF